MVVSMSPITERSPRALVVDRAWRSLGPGLEPLSGPGGAPLTRTVKLVVLPLVIRPSLRPELAADLLDPEQTDRFEALIREAGPRLLATARWFTVLKKTRRTLGIVGGNPQDLYFQLCFELATEHGEPSADSGEVAKAVLLDLADDGNTVEALKDYLRDPERFARLTDELTAAWADRALEPSGDASDLATEVLEDTTSPAFAALVDRQHGSLVGRALWHGGSWRHLGLTAHPTPQRPEVGRGASTSALPAPLDRSLFERLFVVLQASSRRQGLPSVPDLVRDEVGRSCAPFGLHDESLRATAVVGGQLGAGLDPLGGGHALVPPTAAHRLVNRRWQREASALRARRMTVARDPDGGALAGLADELRTPWVAYTRRLWVRLHGRDVRSNPLGDGGSAWEVLDGVARSVMMDHRAKVRSALRALSLSTSDVAEPRSA
jgi:hypothetical protein